ncbi:hypothetical protein SAMN05414137_105273 [Streptacidiphilus jiangxiensis]|uniref:Uncharacterized protein n=1 Tax=Streptacidiphilus jiangxiensis TaxID=235985 RepID=A0A1H7MAR6_STRJI|nr:DUF5691 domain-containing protein [Streptacidiphilus jiangxiensis]SEL08252.1 hypothetical protein SAMN05414137_105273 [Streptacidiphilus jiangxiensis]
MTTSQAPWTDLVEDALLGTNRRASPDLLGRAAAATVARRAGLRPAPAPPLPEPAPQDCRPALPEAAARRLATLLAENSSELLPQWLGTARARGFAAPPELLPALLDAARQRSDLRSDAVVVAGPRGRWLSALNPDWRYVLRIPAQETAAGSEPPTATGTAADAVWQEGLFAERVTHLTRLRRADPAAGLALLRTTWPTERAEDRLLFLDALQEGLGPDDEPFLEAALSDRAKNVRATAAELLSTLPGSGLAARMAERARRAVALGTDGALLVDPPALCDASMLRDGIAATSPTGRGDRAFWLGEIIAATPLSFWAELVEEADATQVPQRVLSRAAAPTWSDELREGWARAAVRQHDAAWARALLAERPEQVLGRAVSGGAPSRLLSVLPAAERAAWTARFVSRQGLADAFQLLVTCAAPWPADLSGAVLDALAQAAETGSYPWSHSGVLGVAERSLPCSAAARIDALAAVASSAWAEVLTRLAETLRTRAAMLAELA